jgi:probable F420-dependent oxidoreductase
MKFFLALTMTDVDDYLETAQVAEEAGYYGVALGDHLLFPQSLYSTYPYGEVPWTPDAHWPDVWVAFAAIGAVTTELRMLSSIFIAPLHSPVVLAGQVGTLARLFEGRVWMGAGAGWMREEFDSVGQDYENRGARLGEQLDLLRKLWSGEMVDHHGRHYDLPPIQISPVPKRSPVILGGGDSARALKRAALQDGWIGAGYELDQAAAYIDRLADFRRAAGTADRDFEILIGLPGRLPSVDECRRLEELGVTGVTIAPLGLQWDPAHTKADVLGRTRHFAESVMSRL